MATLNAARMDSMETVYCTKCYLATPTWKGACIHCKTKLAPGPQLVRRKAPPAGPAQPEPRRIIRRSAA